MNLGIYKPGQGFPVRVMSAVLVGIFTVGLAVFAYNQMVVLASRMTPSSYRIGLEEAASGLKPGDAVELTTKVDSTGKAVVVGTGTVAMVDGKLVTVAPLSPVAGMDVSSGALIRKAGGTEAAPVQAAAVQRGGVQGDPPINPTMLGGSVAAGIVLLGAILGYWFIGLRPATVEFLIATDFEMKKVNWSTPREIIGHTWVVIGACALLAVSLFFVDKVLKEAFTAIDLLPEVGNTTSTVKSTP